MRYRIKISKKIIRRFTLLFVLTGVAVVFDIYFENNPAGLESIEATAPQANGMQGVVTLFHPDQSVSPKTPMQKNPVRKLPETVHNKFLQNHHQAQNSQWLKAEGKKPEKPLVLTCFHLSFRHFFFALPDNDPEYS